MKKLSLCTFWGLATFGAVATFEGSLFWGFIRSQNLLTLLSERRYYGNFKVCISRGVSTSSDSKRHKTQNFILKIYSKLSLFIFFTLYQHLGSKGANVCVLCSISPDHLNQAESRRYEIHAVNVRDHMSGVTSRCLEQLGYSEHCSNIVNTVLGVFY